MIKKAKIALLVLSASIVLSSCKTINFYADSISEEKNANHPDVLSMLVHDKKHVNNQNEYLSIDNQSGITIYLPTKEVNEPSFSTTVVCVKPHFFTSQEANSIATIFFGNVDFYEHIASVARVMTKDEITSQLNQWRLLLKPGTLEEVFGNDTDTIDTLKETISLFIENYQKKMLTAPDQIERKITDWMFQPEENYWYSNSEEKPSNINESGILSVEVDTEYCGIPYYFSAANKTDGKYLLNSLFAYISTGYPSPQNIDDILLQASITNNLIPTSEDIKSVINIAQTILDNLDLGDWVIDQYYIAEKRLNPEKPDYIIHVNAVPAFNGIPVPRQIQFSSLPENNAALGNYYYSEAKFLFSSNGTLLFFELESPLDIVGRQEVDTIPSSEIYTFLIKNLQEIDLDFHNSPLSNTKTDIIVSQLKYGYSRVAANDGSNQFYYIPSVTALVSLDNTSIWGTSLYEGLESGFYPLVTMSLIDGSIIQTRIN